MYQELSSCCWFVLFSGFVLYYVCLFVRVCFVLGGGWLVLFCFLIYWSALIAVETKKVKNSNAQLYLLAYSTVVERIIPHSRMSPISFAMQ